MIGPATNPVFNDNRLKLGLFGINGPGTVMTTHPDRFLPSWRNSLAVAQIADRAGLEAIVPYSRWKPFGNATHVSANVLDTFAWAAGLAATTQYSTIFSTVHVPMIHPLVAAKQGATIDAISGGRFALNIVCGWFPPEMRMFGIAPADHDVRYEHAEEWITILNRLWSETEAFDFHGTHLNVEDASSSPKPVQTPCPPIMNAGSSPQGQSFAAKHADIAFIIIKTNDPAMIAAQVASYKRYARQTFGREIQVWSYGLVIQRDSIGAAEAALDTYVNAYGDEAAVSLFMDGMVPNHASLPPAAQRAARAGCADGGGPHLFGNATDIAAHLSMLSACGIDGMLMTFVDYQPGLSRFVETVLPLLESGGLRQPRKSPVDQ
jgi:alkanesulfonate monooxygenase SsuD/methylene tetrahydromethanopterin reductase-like flavin-dependent oxidoreductase (luciferase family)